MCDGQFPSKGIIDQNINVKISLFMAFTIFETILNEKRDLENDIYRREIITYIRNH